MRRFAITSAVVMSVFLMTPLAQATFHGRNGRIAFRRYFNDAHTHGAIFTMKPDGTRQFQLTHPAPHILSTEPDWSPKGWWITYTRTRNGAHSRLYKIRPNGSDRTYLSQTCTGSCRGDGFSAWAPYGKRIAFERELCSGQNSLLTIYVMRSDGSHARRVTQKDATCAIPHRYSSVAPQWSPSGQRLAFERIDNKLAHHAIFTIRLDGTGLHRLTPWRIDAAQPDWSPNGRWIAFRTQEESDTRGNIALVHPDGTGFHRITHGAGKHKWGSCSFSPNGKSITASHNPAFGSEGNADVYRMKIDGSQRVNLTRSDPWESAPDWGPRHG